MAYLHRSKKGGSISFRKGDESIESIVLRVRPRFVELSVGGNIHTLRIGEADCEIYPEIRAFYVGRYSKNSQYAKIYYIVPREYSIIHPPREDLKSQAQPS
jgi:hypothetical protein